MSNLKIHQIGYLVKKIEAATQTFEALGYQLAQNIVYDDIRKVNICFMTKDGCCIELVSPTTEDSVVSGLMKKYKNCPYHICYETNNFEQDYQELQENGFISIDVPTPAPALQGRDVVFLTNASVGMIELLRS